MADDEAPQRRGEPLPAWKKLLLAVSALVAVGGGALWIYAAVAAGPAQTAPAPAQRAPGVAPQSLVPTERPASPPQETAADPTPLETWSPAIFRLGFSFFAGFCIAYAARAFLRLTLIFVGLALLILAALQFGGIIQVNWGVLEGHYDTIIAWLGEQTSSFTRALSGYLPSAASATAGLAVGFTRRR